MLVIHYPISIYPYWIFWSFRAIVSCHAVCYSTYFEQWRVLEDLNLTFEATI
ncbi:hypothetical protein M413DRAFT_119583 [Hebeloma cylindrosporum]|uniref:Uncharacterized protein n=1 Tax=Hebeloma cylindrosporum TaxID=76867 RepID=A0A0C3C0U9_HEBCY|nr:hypothetical protein M413DRAFT_119583 [Hebeloma cylindrosporum h7]